MSEDTKPHGFWRSVPGILTAVTGIITATAGLVAVLNQAGLFNRTSEHSVGSPSALTGTWTAQVVYPWNVTQQETFSIRVEDRRVVGTATYLGYPRAIEAGQIVGANLSFTTRAEELLGDERRSFENRYDGLISVRGINFVLQDSRGNGPIEFTARKSN